MTIYSGELDSDSAENRTVYDYQTGYGDRMATVAGEAASDVLHGGALGRSFETETAKLSGEGQRAMLAGYGVDTSGMDFPEPREVPISEARERIKSEGLEKHVKLPDGDTIKAPLLDIMVDRGKHRSEYEQALARGPQGFTASALDVGTSLAVHMLDPVNLAASFVPVVGEARWASLMASAGTSAISRAGVRAGIGAVQGGAFAAAFEPLEWYADTQEGKDHTAMDALRNVFFGAALFGGLHVVGGGGADVVRGLRGRELYPFGPGEPRERAHPPAVSELPRAGAAEGAQPVEPAAAPRSFESPADDEFLFVAQEAHPFQRAVADLPPGDQENLMQIALAQVVRGEPVRVAEVLDAAAQHDPRIAESLEIARAGERASPVTGESEIHADVAAQLRAAGMSEVEAEANAAIVAARYASRAARLGQTDAFALYHGEGLSIRGPGGDIADEPDLAARIYGQPKGGPDLFAEREQMGQENLPGTERIGQGELAQRRADQALKPKVAQKPMDEGLFGDSAAQKTLFQSARQAPPFYSALARAVTASKQEKASPEQWLGMLKNTPGVKHEEMDWLGLPDWLKEQKGDVTKQQVADYVRANSVEVREVHKGGPALEARARQLAEQENGAGSWDRIGGGGQEHYWRDARREMGTKFGEWQLPGGENYRELLLTLPELTQGDVSRQAELRAKPVESLTQGEREELSFIARGRGAAGERSMFAGSHWDEPNVLAHIRFNDRTIDGKKTLFIEEIQSDWHQQGRRKGYNQDPFESGWKVDDHGPTEGAAGQNTYTVTMPEGQTEHMMAPRGLSPREVLDRSEHFSETGTIPDAPFKTSWPELSLKRMIRYAAEHGYDQVAWTPGKVQAERYDLSKQISDMRVVRSAGSGGNHYTIDATLKGRVGRTRVAENVPESQLEDHIGKEMARKVVADIDAAQSNKWGVKNKVSGNWSPRFATKEEAAAYQLSLPESVRAKTDVLEMTPKYATEYSGLDLRVGGEGMHGFYDKILPAAANKLVKKFGARVGEAKVKHLDQTDRDVPFIVLDRDGTVVQADIMDENYAAQEARAIGGTYEFDRTAGVTREDTVHALPLTAPLREAAVGEGFPLFQGGEGGPRGRIMLAENKAIVDLFKSADASTFMHEMGHKWLDEMARDAGRENIPQAMKDDLGTVLRWLGVDKAEDIGTAQHEQWARGFEQYLSEGVAPSARLKAAFEKFKQWLAGIYRAIAGRDVPISDDVRAVMGRMLATDEEMAGRAGDTTSATPTPVPSPQGGGEPTAVHVGQRKKSGPAARPEATWSLFEFLAHRGGLKPDPELASIFGGKNRFVPGFGPLIRQGGMTLDHARETALEAGYFVDPAIQHGGVTESTITELLDALGEQERGHRVYRVGSEPRTQEDVRANREAFEREVHGALSEAGIDAGAEPSARMARVLEIMDREGVHDAAEAYERAVMEEERDAVEQRGARVGPVPGWDLHADGGAAPGAGGGPAGPGLRGPGARPRERGQADRAQDAGAYRAIGEQRDPDAAARLDASKAAERQKEPGSIDAGAEQADQPSQSSPAGEEAGQPQSKRTKAAAAEEAQAIAEFDAAVRAGYLTEAERLAVEDAIKAINDGEGDARMVAERGVACLTAAAGGAGARG